MRQGEATTTSNKMAGYFALVTLLFFIWGFLTVMNDILVPYFKAAFELNYFQSSLVQFAFFLAYSLGSLVYFLISATSGDPIAKVGYKNGIVMGLAVSAVGAFLFLPAAEMVSYPFFLIALFVLALGFTLLQISANPYVAVLGPENSASSRLNFSQGFNSLGTTLAPITGGFLIFSYFKDAEGVGSTTIPYLVFAGILAALAFIFFFIKLPDVKTGDTIKSQPVALRFPQLRLGMFAIFCYVGAEVTVGTLLINYLGLPEIAGLDEESSSLFVAIYWGGLMIGRFLGAQTLGRKPNPAIMLGIAALCCVVIFGAISIKEYASKGSLDFLPGDYWPFFVLVAINYLAFFLGKSLPARTLFVFSLFCIALLIGGIAGQGEFAMWSVIGVGLFNSIMWSNIFTMSIEGLGKYKGQGSSLLIMMIIGGATVPPLQGAFADSTGSVQYSLAIPALAYLYLAFYGWVWPQLMKKQTTTDSKP